MNGAEQFKKSPPNYVSKHDPILSESLCGRPTVRGFAMQSQKLFSDFEWAPYAHILASECHGGVNVLGTSWGGAIAEILAGCANQGRLDELQGAGLPTFQVSRLYTFGAPPTALMPIYNHQEGSGTCFRGQRVFLSSDTDAGPTDLVAYSTGFNAFVHARVDAVQLIKMPNGKFDVKVHPCHAYDTLLEPGWDAVFPVLAKIWSDHKDQPLAALGRYVAETHQMGMYMESLSKVADPAKLTQTFYQESHSSVRDDLGTDLTGSGMQNKSDGKDLVQDGVRAIASQASEMVANGLGDA